LLYVGTNLQVHNDGDEEEVGAHLHHCHTSFCDPLTFSLFVF